MSHVTEELWYKNTQWRDSGRMVTLGPFDGRLVVFILIIPFFPSLKTIALGVFAFGLFKYLHYKGYTMPNAIRKILVTMSGKKKSGMHYWRKNKFL